MAYTIKCANANCQGGKVRNIIELIQNNTDHTLGAGGGWIICPGCGQRGWVSAGSVLQEKGETYIRDIKAVIPIKTRYGTYHPYVFLVDEERSGEIHGIHFNYFKDTRAEGGKLKHGHGPGGAPVLTPSELLDLLRELRLAGCLSDDDIRSRLS